MSISEAHLPPGKPGVIELISQQRKRKKIAKRLVFLPWNSTGNDTPARLINLQLTDLLHYWIKDGAKPVWQCTRHYWPSAKVMV